MNLKKRMTKIFFRTPIFVAGLTLIIVLIRLVVSGPIHMKGNITLPFFAQLAQDFPFLSNTWIEVLSIAIFNGFLTVILIIIFFLYEKNEISKFWKGRDFMIEMFFYAWIIAGIIPLISDPKFTLTKIIIVISVFSIVISVENYLFINKSEKINTPMITYLNLTLAVYGGMLISILYGVISAISFIGITLILSLTIGATYILIGLIKTTWNFIISPSIEFMCTLKDWAFANKEKSSEDDEK